VDKLRALVRIPTVSHRDPALTDAAAFDRLRAAANAVHPADLDDTWSVRTARSQPRMTSETSAANMSDLDDGDEPGE
jgi:hypothetical protein